jgi:hydroxymethylbilane synthase
MSKNITLATRKSPLAVIQTQLACDYLKEKLPEYDFSMLKLSTTGDKRRSWSLETEGGKGLFTKELEMALNEGRADLAVHSAKDLPMELGSGLTLAGYLPRADALDVFVMREGCSDIKTIATSSPRRRVQVGLLHPRINWIEIRGNVATRLDKIASGEADATILAAAGLNRLSIDSWPGLIFKPYTIRELVPAVGQGAIALECREGDAPQYQAVLDEITDRAVSIERYLIGELGGGCHSAHAAYFLADILYVYHENHGFNQYDFVDLDDAEIKIRLREIVNELKDS